MFGARYKNIWSSWEEVEEYAYLLDLPTAPILFKGTVDSYKELKALIEKLVAEPSALGGIREGVVARVAKEFSDDEFSSSVFKWVRKDHVQTDKHWTKNWKWAKLTQKYGIYE